MLTKKRFLFWGSLITLLIGIQTIMFIQDGGNLNALRPGSKLGLYEASITSVSEEFFRRSPAFQVTYEEFQQCTWNYCDMGDPKRLDAILAKRNDIIRRDWPHVFDRLIVDGDWLGRGSPPTEPGIAARNAHLLFQKALAQYGRETLRNRCVPIIKFLIDDHRVPFFGLDRNQGYHCNLPPPSRK